MFDGAFDYQFLETTELGRQIWIAYMFLFGATLGSFGNVVIYRLPKGENIALPRSRCPKCKSLIKPWHNIPVFGWLWLCGKCAACRAPISFRYPAVEALMGILFAAAAYHYAISWTLLEVLILVFGLVVVSFIDLDHMILPDKFTLPGIVVGLAGSLINPERSFLDSLFGVLLGGGFLWAIAYLYLVLRKRDGMGGGDIKLLAWIGAVLGWRAVPFVILVASVVGSFVGIGLALFANRSGETATVEETKTKAENVFAKDDGEVPPNAIPFGPFLSAAALIYVLFDGAEWVQWYLDLHGL